MTKGRGFTLTELLVSIAIMAILMALIIPNIDRSLGKNNLANDADLIAAKLEETRLMAGSTQQNNDTTSRFYGLLFPAGTGTSFYMVRLSQGTDPGVFSAPCTPDQALADSLAKNTQPTSCLVDEVKLSRNVTLTTGGPGNAPRLAAYKIPTQQLVETARRGGAWTVVNDPSFNWGNQPLLLNFNGKTAIVSLQSYTGQVRVTYQ